MIRELPVFSPPFQGYINDTRSFHTPCRRRTFLTFLAGRKNDRTLLPPNGPPFSIPGRSINLSSSSPSPLEQESPLAFFPPPKHARSRPFPLFTRIARSFSPRFLSPFFMPVLWDDSPALLFSSSDRGPSPGIPLPPGYDIDGPFPLLSLSFTVANGRLRLQDDPSFFVLCGRHDLALLLPAVTNLAYAR